MTAHEIDQLLFCCSRGIVNFDSCLNNFSQAVSHGLRMDVRAIAPLNAQEVDADPDDSIPTPVLAGQPWDFIMTDEEWRSFGLGRFEYIAHLKYSGRLRLPHKFQWPQIAANWAELKALPWPIAVSWRRFITIANVPPLWTLQKEHARMRRIAYRVWCSIEDNTHQSLSQMVLEQLNRTFPAV